MATPTNLVLTGNHALDRQNMIRRQFDYCFSTKNIRVHADLKKRINHSKNVPITAKEILWYPKLRHVFDTPTTTKRVTEAEAMAALRLCSENINVLDDKFIQCKTPYESEDENDDGKWTAADKVKKVLKPAPNLIAKSHKEVTGFEDGFADIPTTPTEAKEDEDCYAPEIAVHDRLMVAIHRFKARRKFHSEHANVFNKYLKFGGVDTGPARFTGGYSAEELAEMTAFEKAQVQATHFIDDEKADKTKWVLDFEGVTKAYLSSEFTKIFFDYDMKTVDLQCRVMDSFYSYLLVHNVCPECKDDICAARSISKKGRNELTALQILSSKMPGDFNIACSVLLNGTFAETHGGNKSWDTGFQDQIKPEKARIVLMTGMVAFGSDDLLDAVIPDDGRSNGDNTSWTDKLKVAEEHIIGLEVVDIQAPTEHILEMYSKQNASQKIQLAALGKLICKTWIIPSFEEHDLPKSLRKPTFKDPPSEYTFWIEGDILQDVVLGMKMIAKVRSLRVDACGERLWILDGVINMYCSFYTLILNDLQSSNPEMFKEPRWLALEEIAAAKGDVDLH